MSSFEQITSNKNYRVAFVILLLLLLWMASGIFSTQTTTQAVAVSLADDALFKVRAKLLDAQPYASQLKISARTEANRMVNIRAEVSGQVENLPVEKGQLVKAGDVICELAVEDRQLQVEQADAEVKRAQLDYDAALRLKSSGFQALTVIAEKKSSLDTARAELKRAELDLEKIKISAPFDGVVDGRPVEIGDLMQRGDICATILDFDPLLVVGQVAGKNIGRVNIGDKVAVNLLTGEHVDGLLRFVSSNSDNLTRTFRIEVAVPNKNNTLYSGITAEIQVSSQEVLAHLISPSLLALDEKGSIGVRILDDNSIVNYAPVTLLGDDLNGVWVLGLPKQVRLITVGQEYVSDGQQVAASFESSLSPSLDQAEEDASPVVNSPTSIQ
jgi:multidrug efflux system membrane fusion protein